MDTDNRQTDVRGEEVGGWVRRVKGLRKERKKKKKEKLMYTDKTLGCLPEGKRGGGRRRG